jgi:predicted dithiol-disulfide oxidoreductase (DUF899 family)
LTCDNDWLAGIERAVKPSLETAAPFVLRRASYNRDYMAETPDGEQQPLLNVFHRDGDTIRTFWASELFYAPQDPGQDPRHVGNLEPSWNLFDLTAEGRGTGWDEQLSY